jgi:hypothetical protein
LGLKKKGEQVAVIEDLASAPAVSAKNDLTSADNKNKNSNLMKWWNYFFGN